MTNKTQKIGFIHYTYPPVVGGVENLIRTHAKLFQENGYPVTIFTSEGEEANEHINIILIKELASLGKINAELRERTISETEFPQELVELSERIFNQLEQNSNEFDILFAHNIFSLTLNPAIAIAVAKFHKLHPEKKIISWTHDLIFKDRETNPSKPYYPNKDLDAIMHTPVEGVHYVAISEFLKKNLVTILGFPEDRISVIPNGIDITTFLGIKDISKKIISETNLLSSDCVLFFPSKIMPHKNVEICLEALKKLKEYFKHPVLIFSAKEYPHSQKAASYIDNFNSLVQQHELTNNIYMLSDYFVNQRSEDIFSAIRDIYLFSDIILYPSKYENFGLPILEAAITKTPIICSNLEVFNEVSDNNVFQLPENEFNASNFADLILKITTESKQTKLFQRVKQHYLIGTIFHTKILPYIQSL